MPEQRNPSNAPPAPRRRMRGATAIGRLAEAVTAPVFERHGRGHGAIARGWTSFAGEDLAPVSRPKALTPAAKTGRRSDGGTLTVEVMGAHGLDLQYAAPGIMERINTALGYRAVARMRLVQATDSFDTPGTRNRRQPAQPENPDDFHFIASAPLRNALARLRVATAGDGVDHD